MDSRFIDRFAVGALSLSLLCSCSDGVEQRPNVIFILADDLGYGDLSCYGQRHFSTPNIDQMASDGMLFSQHYAGCTVSAPSRCVLMSGQHMGHAHIRGNGEKEGQQGQEPIADELYTMAEMFQDAGYTTGAFGKWGLGFPGSEGDPNNQGFDEFFGYNCQRQAHRYYPEYLWHNQQKVPLEGNDYVLQTTYAPDLIHEHMLKFIQDNHDRPFFAYVPIVQPHAELIAPHDEIFEHYDGAFEEHPFVAKVGHDYGAEGFDVAGYTSQPKPRATFAAMVSRVDKYVGEIFEELRRCGIEDNTIVIFASDNGAHSAGGADPEFFNSSGGLRGMKRDLYEGGIRVPMIAYWRGKIAAGEKSHHVSAFYDFVPTFAELIGVPTPAQCDGVSMVSTLLGQGEQLQHEFLYWEFSLRGGSIAVRMGDWKALRRNIDADPEGALELYNLSRDPSEQVNVAKSNPEIVERAEQIMLREHTPSELFPFKFER